MRVAIVGAGFGGVGMAVHLRRAGIEDVTLIERGEASGGDHERDAGSVALGDGDIVLRVRSIAGGVELGVSDSGPGFDGILAEHAFERFTRGDGARTRGGSGLGFAIVRAVAEAHGGSAEIVPGDLTTVRLRLP